MQLRRGSAHNELTRFRYDVIFRLDREAPRDQVEIVYWPAAALSLENLRSRLTDPSLRAIRVTGIPNARLAVETNLLSMLAGDELSGTVESLRPRLAADRTRGTSRCPNRAAQSGALPRSGAAGLRTSQA